MYARLTAASRPKIRTISDPVADAELEANIGETGEELGAILETSVVLSDEQRIEAIAYMVIGADGAPRLHEEFFVAPVAEGDQDVGGDDDEYRDESEEADEAEAHADIPKYSQRLSDELAMMNTELLAVHIASDQHFALDLSIFFMVDSATRKSGPYDVPSEMSVHICSAPRTHNDAPQGINSTSSRPVMAAL